MISYVHQLVCMRKLLNVCNNAPISETKTSNDFVSIPSTCMHEETKIPYCIVPKRKSLLLYHSAKKLGLGIPAAMFEGIDGSEVLLRFAIGDDAASVLGFFGDGDGEARSITSWCESRKLRNAWATCSRLTFTRTCSSDRIRG